MSTTEGGEQKFLLGKTNISGLLYTVAALAIALGFNARIGTLHPLGILGISIGISSTVLAVVIPHRRLWRMDVALLALLVALAVQFWLLPSGIRTARFQITNASEFLPFAGWIALAAALSGGIAVADRIISWLLFGGAVVVALILGLWTIQHLPLPPIDVYMFQQMSLENLTKGQNPYDMVYPDPYRAQDSARFYGEGVSVNGVLQFGYPYMPLPLLLALPGYLAGDVRYAHALAIALAGIFMALATPGHKGKLAGVLFMFTPQLLHVLGMSWTEPFSVMLLALVVCLYHRARKWTPWSLGLLLASKQYMVVVVPLAFLLMDKSWQKIQVWRFLGKLVGAAAIVTLPLALWDLPSFLHSAVLLQIRQPYRPDSLSYLAWINPENPNAWRWVPFALAAAALGVIFWLHRKRSLNFAGAFGLVMLLFFATNKQAFANYYYLVFGALCCAIAEGDAQELENESKTVCGND